MEILTRNSIEFETVQELAASVSNLKDIPDRYIRPEIELDETFIVNDSRNAPVIDMNKLACTDHLGYEDEMAKLHQACKEWGFFQVVNHGATEEIEKMKVVIEDFFKLPLKQKMACAKQPKGIEGYGPAYVLSKDEKLDWGDMLFLNSLPVSMRDMGFWPNTPSSFRSTVDKYSLVVHNISLNLLKLIARNLGVDTDKFSSMFEDGKQWMRMSYYPPCVQADKVIGLTPHSDANGLTLLVQINDIQGLQIKKNNKWVPINPIPGAIIVNIGDMMEIMSNGEYKSILHRVLANFSKERISTAAFHSPRMRTKIGPLPDLVNSSNRANYKTLELEDYSRLVLSIKLEGKRLLDQMKLN